MAAPNTNVSDLDRADATIKDLLKNLDIFIKGCEKPYPNPVLHKEYQELRTNAVNKALDKTRVDLDSIRARLESTAASSEADAAERKEKQAALDGEVLAAKKNVALLDRAIKSANDRAAEAKEAKAEAKEKKAKAKEEKAKAKEEKANADAKWTNAEIKELDVEDREKKAKKREEEVKKREEDVEKREEKVKEREEQAEKREKEAKKREEEAEKVKVDAQNRGQDLYRREQDLKETVASLKKALTDINDAVLSDVEKLSSTTTNVADELAKVSENMRAIIIATESARTLASDLADQRATTGLGDSTGKRPLSSHAEPTGKRARPKSTGSLLDIDPRVVVSSGRVIRSPRSQHETSVTPGPSRTSNQPPMPTGFEPGPSGPSTQPSILPAPGPYGLIPGFGFCPATIRNATDKTQRTWAQIEFAAGWTDEDSAELLKQFNKRTGKASAAHSFLDRCAGEQEKCLVQVMRKLASDWNEGEDTIANECMECAKKSHFCIWVAWSDANHGPYDENATSGKRWKVTKR